MHRLGGAARREHGRESSPGDPDPAAEHGDGTAIYRSQRLCKPGEAQAWLDNRAAVLRFLVHD
jgi:hypothetical protein